MSITVEINRNLCSGHAICLDIAPEVFTLDEVGKAVLLRPVGPEDEADVRDAAQECPARAIIITGGTS